MTEQLYRLGVHGSESAHIARALDALEAACKIAPGPKGWQDARDLTRWCLGCSVAVYGFDLNRVERVATAVAWRAKVLGPSEQAIPCAVPTLQLAPGVQMAAGLLGLAVPDDRRPLAAKPWDTPEWLECERRGLFRWVAPNGETAPRPALLARGQAVDIRRDPLYPTPPLAASGARQSTREPGEEG